MLHPEITAQLADAHLADRHRWTDGRRRRTSRRRTRTVTGVAGLTRRAS